MFGGRKGTPVRPCLNPGAVFSSAHMFCCPSFLFFGVPLTVLCPVLYRAPVLCSLRAPSEQGIKRTSSLFAPIMLLTGHAVRYWHTRPPLQAFPALTCVARCAPPSQVHSSSFSAPRSENGPRSSVIVPAYFGRLQVLPSLPLSAFPRVHHLMYTRIHL